MILSGGEKMDKSSISMENLRERLFQDEEFKKYGRILENIKVEGILKVMEKIPIPESTVYAASVSELEDVVEEMEQLRIKGYGGLPIQIGY